MRKNKASACRKDDRRKKGWYGVGLFSVVENILTVALEVLLEICGNKSVERNVCVGESEHCLTLCLDEGVSLEFRRFVAACLEYKELVCGTVKYIAADYEVCRINCAAASDVGGSGLVGTCLSEAVACVAADVVGVGDIDLISCRTFPCTDEMLYGVYATENNVVLVGYILHNEVTLCFMRHLMRYACVINLIDVAVGNGIVSCAAVNLNGISESYSTLVVVLECTANPPEFTVLDGKTLACACTDSVASAVCNA